MRSEEAVKKGAKACGRRISWAALEVKNIEPLITEPAHQDIFIMMHVEFLELNIPHLTYI